MAEAIYRLPPNYPDFWRGEYFYPACRSGKRVALVGVGDLENYFRYDWSKVDWQGCDVLFLHHHAGTNYDVFDIDEAVVRRLQGEGIRAHCLDVCQSPLPEKYDYVFAADVIEHTDSPVMFLQNLAFSLAGGGGGYHNAQRRFLETRHSLPASRKQNSLVQLFPPPFGKPGQEAFSGDYPAQGFSQHQPVPSGLLLVKRTPTTITRQSLDP